MVEQRNLKHSACMLYVHFSVLAYGLATPRNAVLKLESSLAQVVDSCDFYESMFSLANKR